MAGNAGFPRLLLVTSEMIESLGLPYFPTLLTAALTPDVHWSINISSGDILAPTEPHLPGETISGV